MPSINQNNQLDNCDYSTNLASEKLPVVQKPAKVPVVFFGRLEKRKGLLTFVEALKLLPPQVKEQINVTFLGKVLDLESSQDKPLNSQQYIEQELQDSLDYEIISNFYSEQAIQYVRNLENPIVCLTSPQENFPNSALEMGQLPIKLVVSDTGGFRETLALLGRTAGIYWFEPRNAISLTQQLSQAISEAGLIPDIPDPASLPGINHKLLSQKLEYIERAFAEVRQPEKPEVRVTLAVVCDNPDSRLIECLSSLESQTYNNLEVFVVDVGSTNLKSQEVIRQAQSLFPQYHWLQLESGKRLGSAYNYLANLSTGDYFLSLQSNIVLFPFAVAKLVETACQSQAVAVTCARINAGGGVVNFSAANLPSLLVADACGCDCTLLLQAFLHGFNFRESQDSTSPVGEIIAAAVAMGKKLAYYPYPLYEGEAEAKLTTVRQLDLKEQYSLRQYLMQIPPAQWSPRQLYLLLAAVQQLSEFPSKMAQLPDFSQEVVQLQAQLQQKSEKLAKAQKWRDDLVVLKRELAQAKARIQSMETSKFWQLREQWFRLKRLMGLPED